MEPRDFVIFALDVSSVDEGRRILEVVQPYIGAVKIGKRLLARTSIPDAVVLARDYELPLMLDNKEFDIPDTLRDVAEQYADFDLFGFTASAAAGDDAIKRMVEATSPKQVIVVTVLTSMTEEQCMRIYNRGVQQQVKKLSHEARLGGATSVVCAPVEVPMLFDDPELAHMNPVTPGIRPLWAATRSQNPDRVMTPAKAVLAAHKKGKMVIGSPIRKPPPEIGSPVEACKRILDDIASVL
ncbi:MAG: orotidine 5'-phosphate decarboxylase / HUMPS family protein [bacterium]